MQGGRGEELTNEGDVQSTVLEQQRQQLQDQLRAAEEKARRDIEALTAQVQQLQRERQDDAQRYTKLAQEHVRPSTDGLVLQQCCGDPT